MKQFGKTLAAASLLAGLATAASTSTAAEFTLFIYESPAEILKRTDATATGQAYWGAYAKYGEALKTAGILRGGTALQGSAMAKTAMLRTGEPQVYSGPRAKAIEELGGFFIIDVADANAALEWARRAPAYSTGAVEVRPAYPAPGMQPPDTSAPNPATPKTN